MHNGQRMQHLLLHQHLHHIQNVIVVEEITIHVHVHLTVIYVLHVENVQLTVLDIVRQHITVHAMDAVELYQVQDQDVQHVAVIHGVQDVIMTDVHITVTIHQAVEEVHHVVTHLAHTHVVQR